VSSISTALRRRVVTEFLPLCQRCGKIGIVHHLPKHATAWIYEITTHSYPWHIPNPDGGPTWLMPFQIHHIKDRENGGGDCFDNLMLLCRSCHSSFSGQKGYRIREEIKREQIKNEKAAEPVKTQQP